MPYSIPLWTILTKWPAPGPPTWPYPLSWPGREGLEDRLQPFEGVPVAADHQAVPLGQAPDAAARARVEEADAPLGQRSRPCGWCPCSWRCRRRRWCRPAPAHPRERRSSPPWRRPTAPSTIRPWERRAWPPARPDDEAPTAPALAWASTAWGLGSYTTTSWPPPSRRCAMFPPILPRPTIPSCIFSTSVADRPQVTKRGSSLVMILRSARIAARRYLGSANMPVCVTPS